MKSKSFTVVGLLIAIFGYLIVFAIQSLTLLTTSLDKLSLTLFGFFLVWVLAILVLLIVRRGEKKPYSSIGLRSIKGKEILIAVVIGVILSLSVPLLTLLVSQFIPATGSGIGEVTSSTSWWILLISVLTAGIVEEILFRGYLLERVNELSGSQWLAILISIVAFAIPHILSWNIAHIVGVVLPLGLILTGLYLWKRNLAFNMIVHLMIDLPLVFMALIAS